MIRFLEESDEDGLGIPYPSTVGNDTNNAGYFDLKENPSAISDIHELAGWPDFESLVRSINGQDSFFKTLRCDIWFASVSGHSKFKKVAIGYVTVAFEILELNLSKSAFDELRRFLKFAPQCLTWPETVINFKHIPTSYNAHQIARAWSEDIEIHGLGKSENEARTALLRGLPAVQAFLLRESTLYSGELKKGRKTIS